MGWFACRRGCFLRRFGETPGQSISSLHGSTCAEGSVQWDTVGPVRNNSHGVACGRRELISWSGGAWQKHRCHVMGACHPPLQSLVAHHASRRQATTQGAKPRTAGPARPRPTVCGEGQGGRRCSYHHWGGIRWRPPHLPISFLYGSVAIM